MSGALDGLVRWKDIRQVARRHALVLSVTSLTVTSLTFAALHTYDEEYALTLRVESPASRTLAAEIASRGAASEVLNATGTHVLPYIFPDRWDARTGAWRGAEPERSDSIEALRTHVQVEAIGSTSCLVQVKLRDPQAAQEIGAAYGAIAASANATWSFVDPIQSALASPPLDWELPLTLGVTSGIMALLVLGWLGRPIP